VQDIGAIMPGFSGQAKHLDKQKSLFLRLNVSGEKYTHPFSA